MPKYIDKINVKNPSNEVEIQLNVNGCNIILTGSNGCGKTRVITKIYEAVCNIVINRGKSAEDLKNDIASNQNWLNQHKISDQFYSNYESSLNQVTKEYEDKLKNNIEFYDIDAFMERYYSNKDIICFFSAQRQSSISHSSSILSLDSLRNQESNAGMSSSSGSHFENYLVSLRTFQSLKDKHSKENSEESKRIDNWFNKLEEDLGVLFEDKSTKLIFDFEKLSYSISQHGKNAFSFQNLSSGISALMAIYADLLMKVQLRDVDANELGGIVFIDEIDAHLHVSLQRKILDFLSKSFPNIQFVVTTHSPFVVMSVDDALIYDISNNETVDDLSAYSYEAVLEGLFGVNAISDILKRQIDELNTIIKKSVLAPDDLNDLSSLLDKLEKNKDNMTSESLYYVQQAQIKLIKEINSRMGGENV